MEKKQKDKPPEEPDEEELLREYEWAKEHIPDDAVPKPAPDEFEVIWKKIQEERGKEQNGTGSFRRSRWKRIMKKQLSFIHYIMYQMIMNNKWI